MENYESEAEKTLNSLQGVSRAEMHPYFYDKVMHRLHQGKELAQRPAFQWATVLGAVTIIFFTGLYYYKSSDTTPTSASQDFAAEYFSNDYQYRSL